jgi:hypothetical protein
MYHFMSTALLLLLLQLLLRQENVEIRKLSKMLAAKEARERKQRAVKLLRTDIGR